MDRETIIRMAEEAGVYATTSMGITRYEALPDELAKFAELVAAHEREACKALCVCGCVSCDRK